MSIIWIPPLQGILFIEQSVTPKNLNHAYQTVHHRTNIFFGNSPIPNDYRVDISVYQLQPGEWYPIGNIKYHGGPRAILTLPLLRSKPHRNWVRDRIGAIGMSIMSEITQEHIADAVTGGMEVKAHCNCKSIYVNSEDLNGKARWIPNVETAVAMRKDFLTGSTNIERFESILDE